MKWRVIKIALLGVLSFVGFIACAVFVIINAIRKRTVKPMLRGMAGCFVILVICLVLTPSGENSDLKEFEKQANKVEMVDAESETEEPEMATSTEVSAESETGELETAASTKSSVGLEAEEATTVVEEKDNEQKQFESVNKTDESEVEEKFTEEKEPNNSYSGYYYHTPGESKGDITMKYSNGNSTETGYHDVNSGEDALANIL